MQIFDTVFLFFFKKTLSLQKIKYLIIMATIEITISDESKLDSIISMLKEFGDVNISKIQLGAKKTKKKAKINWTNSCLGLRFY